MAQPSEEYCPSMFLKQVLPQVGRESNPAIDVLGGLVVVAVVVVLGRVVVLGMDLMAVQ